MGNPNKQSQNVPQAPQAPATVEPSEPMAPPALTNPSAVFGSILFTLPKDSQRKPLTYNDGRVQHNLADAAVQIGETGCYLKGRVVGIVSPGAKQASVEFKWLTTGSNAFRQSVVSYADAEAQSRMDEYRVSVVRSFQTWRKTQPKGSKATVAAVNGIAADLSDLGIE
jgi:hypothetical protein